MFVDYLKRYNLTPGRVLKIAGLGLLGIVILVISVQLIGATFNSVRSGAATRSFSQNIAPMLDSKMAYDSYAVSESIGAPGLSVRNIAPMPPEYDGGTTGDNAEEYEVTEYSANIETRHLDETCAAVAALKAKDYVIFENAGQFDRGCSYTFKVKKANVAEVLTLLETLDPKDLSENTRTIKRLVDDYTGELEILQKKLDSINATLESAIKSYDEITDVATRARDAESLAKIIDSKIQIIERLTQERINVSSQMERIGRSKADELDRLEYTFFYVSVVENKFVDGEQLKDSWKLAIKNFVTEVNQIAQDISINLVAVLLMVIQYAFYLLIVVLVAKYGWRGAKWIWRK